MELCERQGPEGLRGGGGGWRGVGVGGQRLKFLETAAVPKTIYDSFPLLSAFAYSFSEEKFGFFFSFD